LAPTLIASYAVYSASADNTTLTTSSFTPANGEIIIVKAATWSTSDGMSTPTGGSQTYSNIGTAAPGGFNAWCGLWACTVSGSPGSMAVSCAPATGSNTRHSMVVERWSGAALAGSPATNATKTGSGTTATTSLTSTANNSIVSWVLADENSRDPGGSSYVSTSGTPAQDGLYDGHVGSNSVQYFAYQDAATAGSQTFGVTNASALAWVAVGVEILSGAANQEIDLTGIASGEAFGTAQINLSITFAGIGSGEVFGLVALTGGAVPNSQMMDLQGELNRLAKTTGLDEALAANIWAGTTGFMYKTVGAINAKAGTWGLDLDGACNAAAGTAGLAGPGALQTIPTPP
jgi:hypothetical protein